MTVLVQPLGRPTDTVVSPELALVDPSLAELERARPALPPPRPRVRLQLTWTADDPGVRARALSLRDRGADVVTHLALATRRRPRLAAAVVVGAVVLAVGVRDLGVPFGGSGLVEPRPQSPLVLPAAPPAETQAPANRAARPGRKPAGGTARRFAWAPVTGAEGYHIELFRGSERVFSADADVPAISVPARWTYRGKTRTLAPGEYRWYVWPRVSGKRSPNAVVQAKLDVPSA